MFPMRQKELFRLNIPLEFRCGNIQTRTDAGDNFNPTDPEATRQLGRASGSKNHVQPEDTPVFEVASANDEKRFQSNDRIIMDNSEDHKRCRNKIDSMRGHILATDSEQGGMKNDLPLEIRKTSQLEVNEVRQQGNIKKTIQQCSLSNLDNFESTKNENPESKISNFEAFKSEGVHSIDYFYAVPGPSVFQDNKTTSNLSSEAFPFTAALEQQPAVETGEKISLCAICRWEVDKHFNEVKGKYKNAVDSLQFSVKAAICRSIQASISLISCLATCGEFIFDKDAHDSEQTCNVCLEKFQCKTLLETYTLIHMDYFDWNCMVCGLTISDRLDPVTNFYNCCHCEKSMYPKSCLLNHLQIHTGLKIFKCHVCGRRFTQYAGLCNHLRTHSR